MRKKKEGLKPGWVRINLHYTFSREELDFLLKTVEFVANYGYLFLSLYSFNMNTGEWIFKDFEENDVSVNLENDFETKAIDMDKIHEVRKQYLREAEEWAGKLAAEKELEYTLDESEIEELKYFYYI